MSTFRFFYRVEDGPVCEIAPELVGGIWTARTPDVTDRTRMVRGAVYKGGFLVGTVEKPISPHECMILEFADPLALGWPDRVDEL